MTPRYPSLSGAALRLALACIDELDLFARCGLNPGVGGRLSDLLASEYGEGAAVGLAVEARLIARQEGVPMADAIERTLMAAGVLRPL